MRIDVTSAVLGGLVSVFLAAGLGLGLFFFVAPKERALSHRVALPAGGVAEVTRCNFAWGAEHDERDVGGDCFVLEYVSTVPHADSAAVDRETLEVFELVRPVSEQWGLATASVSAFPSVNRRGKYVVYLFTRAPAGEWTFQRSTAGVFVHD